MAVLWLWGGLVYHAGYFTRINPVAWGFSSLFVVQGLLLFWYGVGLLQFGTAQGPSWWLGIGLAAYALLYPMLGVLTGHGYPASPTFGVPCPTSLLTAGLFITSSAPPPVPLLVVPIAWAMVGGSAAVVLSVPTDYLLLASALLLPLDSLVKRWKGAL
jgi:hypothetical protein